MTWIPLSESKPADNEDVLFVVKDDRPYRSGGVYLGSRHSGYMVRGVWHPLDPSWSVAYDMYEGEHWPEHYVTHWQPLPEPP